MTGNLSIKERQKLCFVITGRGRNSYEVTSPPRRFHNTRLPFQLRRLPPPRYPRSSCSSFIRSEIPDILHSPRASCPCQAFIPTECYVFHVLLLPWHCLLFPMHVSPMLPAAGVAESGVFRVVCVSSTLPAVSSHKIHARSYITMSSVHLLFLSSGSFCCTLCAV